MNRRFFRASLLLGLLASIACVPSGEAEPRGAVALPLEISAATKGDSWVSADGWTVSMERVVFDVVAQAEGPGDPTSGEITELGGAYDEFLVDARAPYLLELTGIPAGPHAVRFALTPPSMELGTGNSTYMANVSAESRQLFFRDGTDDSLVFVALLTKGADIHKVSGRVRGRPLLSSLDVTVLDRQEITAAPVPVRAERLFLPFGKSVGDARMQAWIDADSNGDGTTDDDEIAKAPALPEEIVDVGSDPQWPATRKQILNERLPRVFAP